MLTKQGSQKSNINLITSDEAAKSKRNSHHTDENHRQNEVIENDRSLDDVQKIIPHSLRQEGNIPPRNQNTNVLLLNIIRQMGDQLQFLRRQIELESSPKKSSINTNHKSSINHKFMKVRKRRQRKPKTRYHSTPLKEIDMNCNNLNRSKKPKENVGKENMISKVLKKATENQAKNFV